MKEKGRSLKKKTGKGKNTSEREGKEFEEDMKEGKKEGKKEGSRDEREKGLKKKKTEKRKN